MGRPHISDVLQASGSGVIGHTGSSDAPYLLFSHSQDLLLYLIVSLENLVTRIVFKTLECHVFHP